MSLLGIELPRNISGNLLEKILNSPFYVELEGDWFLSKERIERIKPFIKRGKLISVHLPFGKENDISKPETKEKAINKIKNIMEKLPNSNLNLILHPGEAPKGKNEEKTIVSSLSSIKEILKFTEGMMWKIALENLPPDYPGDSIKSLDFLLKELDKEKVGMCLDTGHANLTGTLFEILEKFSSRILTFHLHDNDGWKDTHLQPPYGTINWEKFIPLLPDKNFILECYPWGKASLSYMYREIKALLENRFVKEGKFYVQCPVCRHFLFEEGKEKICYCKK